MNILSKIPLFLLFLEATTLSTIAYAQEMHALPPYMHHDGTFLNFTTTGEAKAKPTLLTLHFSAQINHHSPIEAQQKLNKIIDQTLTLSKKYQDITTQAGTYTIEEDYNPHGSKSWNAHQEITLTSHDTQKLFELAQLLQNQGLLLNSTEWSLDSKDYKELEDQARQDALKKIRPEIEEDAHILGLKLINIDRIDILPDTMPLASAKRNLMMMAAPAPALHEPQITASEQIIHVHASIRAYLKKE